MYEILQWDCIGGSWWNKVLKEEERAPGEMESSFGESRRACAQTHIHTCTDCLHWAETVQDDAFLLSRWAHQIRILVFTLDFSLPKCVHVCMFLLLSW